MEREDLNFYSNMGIYVYVLVVLLCVVPNASLINTKMTGISEGLECNIGVIGQQGYVELEVCNLVEEILRTATVYQSLEQ